MSDPETEPDLTEADVAPLDAEGDNGPEQTGEPEQTAAPDSDPVEDGPDSQAQMEEIGKKLDGLTKHVARRMSEILGESANDFEECELCTYWNTPGWRFKGPLPEAVTDALRAALGEHSADAWKADEYSRACDKCNGIGQVLTGSKAPGQETIQCIKCHGMGWVPIGNERASGVFAIPNGPTPQAPATVAPVTPSAPDTPEVAAAKALLQKSGHMVIDPFVPAA